MAIAAPHYSPEALKFFRGLKRNNDREWFNARKAIYEREVKLATQTVVAAINEEMLRFAPENVQPPQKATFRIYRDVRFSSDKRPYKTHQGAWWARSGLEKTSGGGFYFHVAGDEVIVAAGVYMPEREQLLAIRRHIEANHEQMRALMTAKKLKSLMSEFDGNKLTRAPKGFLPDSPAADLILNRQWGFSAKLPVEVATTPGLVKEIVKRFEAAAPLVAFLNTPLAVKARKPLF
ncbi:MAG: DUF2461 domain-containing protein [Edaphobacter sp.]|uniref:DUF2461 domain-containing protein n=1 Tax=Edaphobacter sp. TaxID=1934404 RepID=UPI0023A71575|nr:DUF2461 domain-containing protein [Edaphobacter sp.]MDE1176755.1 DUF2461 domain-containing protein [Edaphobacter sp.]